LKLSIDLEKEIIRGQDIKMQITCYDWDELTLIDPTSNTVEFYDSAGTLAATVNDPSVFTKISDGVVRLIWRVPADAIVGWWTAYWTAVKTSYQSIKSAEFEVIAK
jgi:hypothetical protein